MQIQLTWSGAKSDPLIWVQFGLAFVSPFSCRAFSTAFFWLGPESNSRRLSLPGFSTESDLVIGSVSSSLTHYYEPGEFRGIFFSCPAVMSCLRRTLCSVVIIMIS